jgi:YHS domain-containing protein
MNNNLKVGILLKEISNMKIRKSIFILILSFSVGLMMLRAQDSDALRLKQYNLNNGLALEGYDPVSYFSGNPTKGKKAFQVKYKSVLYQFTTQKKLDKFNAEPAKYEPAYGGWCAYALGAKNAKVEVNPETFKIIGGRLYLFYNTYFNNTLTDWNKDEINLKKKADTNWISKIK